MKKVILAGGGVGLLLVAAIASVGFSSQAGEAVLIRGIVQSRDGNTINMNYTHIAAAADKSKWQGLACDVNLGNAKRFVWEEKSGVLVKTRTTAIPAPGKEVIFKGTVESDCRGTASWSVVNYREFTMNGTLEGITLDTGKTDAGWMTITVTGLTSRDVVPARKFKEAQYKGVDVRVRFNGLTKFAALGKSKQADEVTKSNQKMLINGEMQDGDVFVASTVNEL